MQGGREQTGYIFKRGKWWMLRYREALIENGQVVRRQVAKRVARVQDEHKRLKRPPDSVEAAAKAMLLPVNSGAYSPESSETLIGYVERKFFPDQERLIRSSTLASYKRRWAFVKPYCGDVRLREFKTVDGTRILNKIARQNPQLLHSTLQHFKSLLSAFFTYAISQGILDGEVTINGTRKTVFGNPMRSVRIPTAPEGEDTYAYSTDEVRSILFSPTSASDCGCRGLRRTQAFGDHGPRMGEL